MTPLKLLGHIVHSAANAVHSMVDAQAWDHGVAFLPVHRINFVATLGGVYPVTDGAVLSLHEETSSVESAQLAK